MALETSIFAYLILTLKFIFGVYNC